MGNISGVSGVFVVSKDPRRLADWYSQVMGLEFNFWKERQSYGLEFVQPAATRQGAASHGTVFAIHPGQEAAPSPHRLQFRTQDTGDLRQRLAEMGVEVTARDDYDYGCFTRINDPDGNEIEFYEPT